MTDQNLIREVDEDLERQRLEALWKRYGTFVVVGVLAIILGTAANSYRQTSEIKMHQKATGDLVVLLNATGVEQDKKIADLVAYAENNPEQTQGAFAALHAAAHYAQKGEKDKAIKIYDALAANTKTEHAFRQFADLLSVQQQMETGDIVQLQKRLEPLMARNEPWRASAKEASGYLSIRAGDKAKAKEIFTELSQDASVPPSLSARAADMLRLISE